MITTVTPAEPTFFWAPAKITPNLKREKHAVLQSFVPILNHCMQTSHPQA
jgi:hypothetical protein